MGGVPDGFQFRAPWRSISEPRLHEELYRELSPQHQLFGVEARAVAVRQDNDDVLFELSRKNAPVRFAVVHLTWSDHSDQFSTFPGTHLYVTFSDWVTNRMIPDADDWELSEST